MRMRYSHRPLRATGMRPAPACASPVVGCRRLRDGRAGDDDERRRHARRDLLCISFARDGKCVNETMWPSMKKSFSSEMDDTWDDYNFVTVVLTKWMWGLGESFIVGRRTTRSQTPPNSLSFFQTSGNPIGSERTLGSLFQTTCRRRKQAMWTPSPGKLFFSHCFVTIQRFIGGICEKQLSVIRRCFASRILVPENAISISFVRSPGPGRVQEGALMKAVKMSTK